MGNSKRKEYCKRGHELTDTNSYRRPSRPSDRQCRICVNNLSRFRRRPEVAGKTILIDMADVLVPVGSHLVLRHPGIPAYIQQLVSRGALVRIGYMFPPPPGAQKLIPDAEWVPMPAHDYHLSAGSYSLRAGWEACLSRNDLP